MPYAARMSLIEITTEKGYGLCAYYDEEPVVHPGQDLELQGHWYTVCNYPLPEGDLWRVWICPALDPHP